MSLRTSQTKKHSSVRTSSFMEASWLSGAYFVVGSLWIFFSDAFLQLARSPEDMVTISNIKGWAYVVVTAVLLWIAVYRRTRKRNASEATLAESEARFKLLVDSAPDAVMLHTNNHFTYVNTQALKLLRISKPEDIIGKESISIVPLDRHAHVYEKLRQVMDHPDRFEPWEDIIQRSDGELADVEMVAVPFHSSSKNSILVYMRDITDRKQAERERVQLELQVRQKHRLESIGTLAGGIAHEINNPITGIINYAQLIADSPFADEQLREYSREIMHEGLRVAGTVKTLLSFSQYDKKLFYPVPVSSIVGDTISLLDAVLRHDQIALTVRVEEGLPYIRCSGHQLRQVLMNLLTNARDALNARYNGYHANKQLILTVDSAERKKQPWVRFTVEDHGEGIDQETLNKAFDPFFTTSTRSEHAGLGLSISLSIIKEHRGDIWFESQPGEYTRAIVELPADNSEAV